jgi:hypothetical protein
MNALYIIGGIVLLMFGIWLCVKEAKVFMMGKQDKLGANIKILSGGIGFIMIGLYLIFKYL